jgi:hypothetical protein
VPIKKTDVEKITDEIYRVAREQGVEIPGEEGKKEGGSFRFVW